MNQFFGKTFTSHHKLKLDLKMYVVRLILKGRIWIFQSSFSNFARRFVVKNAFVLAVLLPSVAALEQNSKNKSIFHNKCTRKIAEGSLEYSDTSF